MSGPPWEREANLNWGFRLKWRINTINLFCDITQVSRLPIQNIPRRTKFWKKQIIKIEKKRKKKKIKTDGTFQSTQIQSKEARLNPFQTRRAARPPVTRQPVAEPNVWKTGQGLTLVARGRILKLWSDLKHNWLNEQALLLPSPPPAVGGG